MKDAYSKDRTIKTVRTAQDIMLKSWTFIQISWHVSKIQRGNVYYIVYIYLFIYLSIYLFIYLFYFFSYRKRLAWDYTPLISNSVTFLLTCNFFVLFSCCSSKEETFWSHAL